MGGENDNREERQRDILSVPHEDIFRAFLDQTPDNVYIKDLQSRFVMVSRTLLEGFGLESDDEIVGKTDFDFFTHEHAQQAFDDEQEILRTGLPMISKEEKETWVDGKETWVSSTKAPLFLTSGHIAGLLGISRDITEHRRNEQKVLEQNAIMNRDMESAHNLQSVLIPGEIPRHPAVRTAVWLRPMAAVGGDFVTYPADPMQRMLFFIGDVAGHSISAALFTVLIKYLADRRGELYTGDPREFLSQVDHGLTRRIPDGFVTGLCGHFERTATGMDLLVSNAGHPDVLVCRRATRQVERIRLRLGAVLGLGLEAASAVDRIALSPGDRVYAFTDGVTETRNPAGEEYGIEPVAARLGELMDLNLGDSLKSLAEDLAKYRENPEQQDDVTMLGFEINPDT